MERKRIIHSSELVCSQGEPFFSPLSDNLTRRQPANILICPGIFISHTLILILVLLTTFAVSSVQFRISYSFPPCFNWRDSQYTRFQSPISSLSRGSLLSAAALDCYISSPFCHFHQVVKSHFLTFPH